MKKILLIITAFIFSISIFAQDIIITQDSKKISAIILEVDLDIIKYKNFDNQEGPIYSIRKSDVNSIIYQNGTVEAFANQPQAVQPQQPIYVNSSPYAAMSQEELQKLYQSATSLKKTGAIFSVLPVGLLPVAFGLIGTSVSSAFFAISSVCLCIGIPCWIVGGVKSNNIKPYLNTGVTLLEFNDKCSLEFATGNQSVGLSLRF